MQEWFSPTTMMNLLRTGILLLLSVGFSACQHGEPYASPTTLNPHIAVAEIPPKPLPDSLVVKELPPEPPRTAVAQVEPVPAIQSQPPALQLTKPSDNSSFMVPVGYPPKKAGTSAALENYLDHRIDDAISILKQYPTDDQDIALIALPMLARMDQGETWGSLNGPQKLAQLELLRNLIKRLSKSAPLVLQHVSLVEEQPLRYGEVKPRQNTNYYPEDLVFAYAELVNLLDYANADGKYNIRLDVTVEIHNMDGKVVLNETKPYQKAYSMGPRQDFYIAAYLTLPKQLTPGNYQLMLSVLDRDTNRTARQSVPLQVLEARAKSGSSVKRKG